jgi:hypothetical protein
MKHSTKNLPESRAFRALTAKVQLPEKYSDMGNFNVKTISTITLKITTQTIIITIIIIIIIIVIIIIVIIIIIHLFQLQLQPQLPVHSTRHTPHMERRSPRASTSYLLHCSDVYYIQIYIKYIYICIYVYIYIYTRISFSAILRARPSLAAGHAEKLEVNADKAGYDGEDKITSAKGKRTGADAVAAQDRAEDDKVNAGDSEIEKGRKIRKEKIESMATCL